MYFFHNILFHLATNLIFLTSIAPNFLKWCQEPYIKEVAKFVLKFFFLETFLITLETFYVYIILMKYSLLSADWWCVGSAWVPRLATCWWEDHRECTYSVPQPCGLHADSRKSEGVLSQWRHSLHHHPARICWHSYNCKYSQHVIKGVQYSLEKKNNNNSSIL